MLVKYEDIVCEKYDQTSHKCLFFKQIAIQLNEPLIVEYQHQQQYERSVSISCFPDQIIVGNYIVKNRWGDTGIIDWVKSSSKMIIVKKKISLGVKNEVC